MSIKGEVMIKVIVGYKLKKGADIQPILMKLWSASMTFIGFIGAENLQSEQDASVVAVITTWERVEDWRAWEGSEIRRRILRLAEPLLEEEPKVTAYRIMPTLRWVG